MGIEEDIKEIKNTISLLSKEVNNQAILLEDIIKRKKRFRMQLRVSIMQII